MKQQALPLGPAASPGYKPIDEDMPGSIFIRSGVRFYNILLSEIEFVEAQKNFCRFVTFSGKFLVFASLAEVEEILPAARFCRSHRSYIIGLAHIKNFDRRTVQMATRELPIGDSYLQSLIHSKPVIGVRRAGNNVSRKG